MQADVRILDHAHKSEKDSNFLKSQYSPANCLLEKMTHYNIDVTVACYTLYLKWKGEVWNYIISII